MLARLGQLLGPVNAPSSLLEGAPSLLWPLAFAAIGRLAYGIDAFVHGSPQMRLVGGPAFSLCWSSLTIVVGAAALAGTLLTARTGRARLELLGDGLSAALSAGFVVGVAYNAIRFPDQGLVGAWQPAALGAIAAWRAYQIGREHRPGRRREGSYARDH